MGEASQETDVDAFSSFDCKDLQKECSFHPLCSIFALPGYE